MVERETCISVGDLAGDTPSRGFEGPGSGFFVSVRGGGLVALGDGLFRFCNRESVDGGSMVPRENGHLAGRDIRSCCSLSYLIRDDHCGFLEEHSQR